MALRLALISLTLLTITGVHAQVTSDPDELDTEGIVLTCTDTEMIVEIPKTLLTDEMLGEDVRFENEVDSDNEYCWGTDDTNDQNVEVILLTTNLTACGTNRTETADEEIYTNRVISNYADNQVIARQFAIDIPLTCTYNRTRRVNNIRYQLTDYTIDKTLSEGGEFTYTFEIYSDDTYENAVTYPFSIGLNEELHFAASVLSLDGTLDLSIRSCKATPNSDYNSDPFFFFIQDGCSADGLDTNITTLEPNYRIGVEMNTFRFIEEESGLVYIHCNLLVCDSSDPASTCNEECSTVTGRRRRDVSTDPRTKRFTRGPLRIARAAKEADSISRLEISSNGATTQQDMTSTFNPWMVAMAAMATVVLAMAGMMAVVLRKVSQLSATPKRSKNAEETARLLDETEEI